MKILSPTPDNIRRLAAHLRDGGIAGVPTETVYGLGANAFNPEAVLQVFKAKKRPKMDPLIVHVSQRWLVGSSHPLNVLANLDIINVEGLSPLARERAHTLLKAFWPGPFTLILPKNPKIPDLVTSGLQTVAVRMPSHPIVNELIDLVGSPIAAPSANRFGKTSPTLADHVKIELDGIVPYVLDGGPCEIGVESTIVYISNDGSLRLCRPGAISRSQIEEVTGSKIEYEGSSTQEIVSPGQFKSHYAPEKPLYLLKRDLEEQLNLFQTITGPIAVLLLEGDAEKASDFLSSQLKRPVFARSLSKKGSRDEAAQSLFTELRNLDRSDARAIFAEECLDEDGLGFAIRDRLQRAAQATF